MAPEVVNNQPYNEKVDIYSFGVILRLLLTGTAAAPQEEPAEDRTIEEDRPSDNSKHSGIEPMRPGAAAAAAATSSTTIPMQLLIGARPSISFDCIR